MIQQKMNHANAGVKCIVNTCHYYMQGDQCSAERIEVQPKNARDTQETDCATFITEAQANL
ncbi:MAG: DUF1540 domain-containing protein [Clostridiaceae bacterium]|nr:DUF1540 domain-containing protein [Clostridiaceae bacterium]